MASLFHMEAPNGDVWGSSVELDESNGALALTLTDGFENYNAVELTPDQAHELEIALYRYRVRRHFIPNTPDEETTWTSP